MKSFQTLLDKIVPFLPSGWKRLLVYLAKNEGVSDFKYYVDSGKGFIECFYLEGFDIAEFSILAFDVDDIFNDEWENLAKSERWSLMTMVVESSGRFEVDYGYDPIGEGLHQYYEEWKKRMFKT